MFGFAFLCVQIVFVQYAFSQSVTPTNINIGLPSSFGSPSLAAANLGAGLTGQMMSGGIPAAAFGAMGPQALGITPNQIGMTQNQMGLTANQMGMPAAIAANSIAAGYAANYGGSGSGDVAVAGELPVAGTTAIAGQVPLSGKVQFTGTLPAGGIVTISGQCGCGTNNGQLNAPLGGKSFYNNKPYLY